MVSVSYTAEMESVQATEGVDHRGPDVHAGSGRSSRALFALRLGLGLALVVLLVPLSVDDYFRVYHAIFFWQRPSFSPSTNWLPLYVWLHGPLIGLIGETRLAPRLASLFFGLLGCALAVRDADDADERRARFLLAACLPSSVLLFALPLSEALFGALVSAHVGFLARYRERGRIVDAFVASLAMLAATATRYEVWALLPISTFFAARRQPADARRSIGLALSFLPWAFPLRWLVHLGERTGDPFSFLGVIARDQFGPGDLASTLFGTSWPIAIAFAVAVVYALRGLSRAMPERIRLASLYGLGFVGFFVLVASRDSLPSQLPFRLFHVPMLLSVPSLAFHLAPVTRSRRTFLLGLLGMALGVLVAIRLPGVIAPDDARLGGSLRRALAADPAATALVEGPFPEVSAFVVAASAVDRVFVEKAGGRCLVAVHECRFPCGRPAFLDHLRFAIVASPSMRTHLEAQGFRQRAHSRRYVLLERTVPRPALCAAALSR